MEITKAKNGMTMTVYLNGKLDTNTAPSLEKAIDAVLVSDEFNNLEINMKELTYLSSAGLRVLLSVQKKLSSLDAQMVITNANANIKSVFEITGFLGILNII